MAERNRNSTTSIMVDLKLVYARISDELFDECYFNRVALSGMRIPNSALVPASNILWNFRYDFASCNSSGPWLL